VADEKTAGASENIIFKRQEDFTSLYANNVVYESSAWDFKFIFGELDQRQLPNTIEQHTSMSVSWLQAKLMAYFLEANLAIHEADYGTIRVPPNVIPPRPDPSMPAIENNELAKAVMEYLGFVHKRLFGEAKPPTPPKEPLSEGELSAEESGTP
jgi:hypothetical protein